MKRSATLTAIAILTLQVAVPAFGTTTFGVGVDYVTGPLAQSSRDVLGFAVTSWKGKDLTVAAARFDHSDLGPGTIGSAALGLPLSSTASVQISGARTAGDESYRAWLFQAGPLFAIGGGRTLGILYTRAGNTLGPGSTGLSSEVGVPLSTVVNLSGRGSVASVEGGGTSLQGAVGLIWGLSRRVVLLGEVGRGRDVTAIAQGNPLQTGFPSTASQLGQTDYVSGSSLQVGLRYVVH